MSCNKCKDSKCTCAATICENPLLYAMKEAFSLVGTTCADAKVVSEYALIIEQGTPPSAVPFTHTIDTALVSVLVNGISVTNSTDICCPDCKSDLYFIVDNAEITNFLNEATDNWLKICCLEHEASVSTWKTIKALYETKSGGAVVKCCNTDFNDKISRWTSLSIATDAYFNPETLLNSGAFESSSFSGYSGLGIILDYLELNKTDLTATDYLNILGIILKLGFVVSCEGADCNVQISAMKVYNT